MPGRDGTGPLGNGRADGRGFGPCAGVETPDARPRFGLGAGMRRGAACGRGRGFGWRLASQNETPKTGGPSKDALKRQVVYLESLLKDAKANLERFAVEAGAAE